MAIVTVFLCSVERRFSVPAIFIAAGARNLGQDWPRPPAKPARSGHDAGEHEGSLIVTVAAASPTNFARVLRRCRPLLIDGRCGDGWHGERRRFAWRRP